MKLFVTDHAVLRYLERHGGFEIEKLRKSMENRLRLLAATGADRVIVDGIVFVFRPHQGGRAVVTALNTQLSTPRDALEGGDG